MKDAFGGILNIVLIALFLVIIEGILGLVVNYTKAFKMKNIAIAAYEKYEGAGECKRDTACFDDIKKEAQKIGYHPPHDITCSRDYTPVENYFCYQKKDSYSGKNFIYSVETQVDINIPIINRIMGLSFFKVRGDTRIIKNRVIDDTET